MKDDDPKLARLSTDEIVMLHAYRGLNLEGQEHVRELAMQMGRRLRAKIPSNVYLLSDPQRRFPAVRTRKAR